MEQATRSGLLGIDWRGLIDILAKNLYSQDDMFIRELIQNAHDSIVKRRASGSACEGRIDIFSDRDSKTIVFQDDGSGMDEREVTLYLATIGSSGTRELKEQLRYRDRRQAESLIGQFGIGVMSAFVVAEEITVESLSFRPEARALCWKVRGGPEYELESINKDEVGTRVRLTLKDEYLRMTDEVLLRSSVLKYADFLPFPIYINGQGPINTQEPPWYRDYANPEELRAVYSHWIQERFPDVPLEIIPVDLEGPQAKGVLYISDRHVPDVNMSGALDIYQARMFICEGDRNLLPAWAKFVRGVIDSPALTPTASRDAVQHNQVHATLRAKLGDVIVSSLKNLARTHPGRFRRLMQWHHYHLKGMAVGFDDFFDAICDTVLFTINVPDAGARSHQMVTLPDYLRLQPRLDSLGRTTLFYVGERDLGAQLLRLCQATGLVVIDASLVFDEQFLEKYAARRPQSIVLSRVDLNGHSTLFEQLLPHERRQFLDLEFRLAQLIEQKFPHRRIRITTERFAPSEIPAVLTRAERHNLVRNLRMLSSHPALGGTWGQAMEQAISLEEEKLPPMLLHLNASSRLIQRLNHCDWDEPAICDAWLWLYNSASFLAAPSLNGQDIEALQAQSLEIVENIIHLSEEQNRLKAHLASRERHGGNQLLEKEMACSAHTRLLLLRPTGKHADRLECALREVLEGDPYWFQLIRHRSERPVVPLDASTTTTVHGFLVDGSQWDSAFLTYLGMVLQTSANRLVILLLREGTQPLDFIATMNGVLPCVMPEGTGSTALVETLRTHLGQNSGLVQLRQNRIVRYLSPRQLAKRVTQIQLSKEQAEVVCRQFPTIEELLAAGVTLVRDRTQLSLTCAAAIVEAFEAV